MLRINSKGETASASVAVVLQRKSERAHAVLVFGLVGDSTTNAKKSANRIVQRGTGLTDHRPPSIQFVLVEGTERPR